MTKKINKIITSVAITLPLILGACGGSGSSSGDSSATLTASDIDVSVSCGEWRTENILFGKADCDITIKNKSAASGTIYVLWTWKDGDTSCGVGNTMNSSGQPSDVSVDANETGTISTTQTMMCAAGYADPKAENIRVTVRN
jgi:hypothetical protein